jgi:arsenate reductase
MEKIKVLFICTHNSARSQMAEGYLRAVYGDRFEVFSAGTEKTRVNPEAIKIMQEIGIDISDHRSKDLSDFLDTDMDIVVTVCDGANAVCPFFPGAKKTIHIGFPDPSSVNGTPEEIHETFRVCRDTIIEWIDSTFVKEYS